MPIRLRNTEAGTDGIGAALSDPGGGRNRLVGTDAEAAAASWFAAPSLSEEAYPLRRSIVVLLCENPRCGRGRSPDTFLVAFRKAFFVVTK